MCKWNTHIVTCPCTPTLSAFGLATANGDTVVKVRPFSTFGLRITGFQLPIRYPDQRQMGVVACFSRLFFGERWQVMVALLEVYRQYGVDLQVYYVQSALTEILDYLKVRDSLTFED